MAPSNVPTVLKQLMQESPFIGDTWRLMNGWKSHGITAILENMFKSMHYSTKTSVGNKLRELTLRGFMLCNTGLKSPAAGIEFKIPFLSYFYPEEWAALAAPFVDVLNIKVSRNIWAERRMHIQLGNRVDSMMKMIFRGRAKEVPGVYVKMALAIATVLGIEFVWGDLKVSSPCVAFGGHADCEQCTRMPDRTTVNTTAVDLVGVNTKERKVVLIELKTFKGIGVDELTLRKYTTQAWLTWLMFMSTYRDIYLPHQVTMKIVVLLPSVQQVCFFNISPPVLTTKLINSFPFLKCMCSRRVSLMTPNPKKPKVRGPFAVHNLVTDKTYFAPINPEEMYCKRMGRRKRKAEEARLNEEIEEYDRSLGPPVKQSPYSETHCPPEDISQIKV